MRASPLRSQQLLLAAVAVAAAAGCYRSSGAPAQDRVESITVPLPPRIVWLEHGFVGARLPAVSADGAAVLLGIQDADGGRGNPNYRLELRDRSDGKLAAHVVLAANDADAMIDAGGKTAELDRRIAAANAWLAEQHRARRFTPLERLEVDPGEEIASAFRATGGGVTLEWRPSRLTIARGGAPLLDRATPPTWLAEDRPMGGGGTEVCHNPAYLGGAAVSLPHRLAVLQIAYGGTDMCWEPNAAHHVVAW
jgi:hypothetical protein